MYFICLKSFFVTHTINKERECLGWYVLVALPYGNENSILEDLNSTQGDIMHILFSLGGKTTQHKSLFYLSLY